MDYNNICTYILTYDDNSTFNAQKNSCEIDNIL